MGLQQVQQDWQRLGTEDPLWAVLSEPDARGGKWDEDAFFETGRREISDLLAFVEPPADGRCLDFGCGVGRLTLPLAGHFREAVGVDVAPAMIEKANTYKGVVENVTFLVNDTADLRQFPDGHFDFINAYIVLQHMPPELAIGYLREFRRVLGPDGILAFTMPSQRVRKSLKTLAYRVLPQRLIWALKRRRDGAVMEMHGHPIDHLIPVLEEFGLRVDKIHPDDSGGRDWISYQYVCTRA